MTPLDTVTKKKIDKTLFTTEGKQQQHESATTMINNEKNLKIGDMKNSGDILNTAVNTVSALVDAAESGAFLLKSFFNDKVINMENKGENTENNGKRQIYGKLLSNYFIIY